MDFTLKTLLERSIEQFADKTALCFVDGETMSFAEFGRLVGEVSGFLLERGVAVGDRVALLGENMPNWGVAYFAATTIGAVAVPILPDFPIPSIRHILNHSEANTIFVSSKLMDKLEPDMTANMLSVVVLDDLSLVPHQESKWQEARATGRREFHKLVGAARRMAGQTRQARQDIGEDDLAAIVYTSGTTGHSKGVMLTHKNIVANAVYGNKVGLLGQDDRMLSVLPLAHTYECSLGLVLPLMAGSTVHYLDKPPTARVLLPAMQQVRPTKMLTVPLIMEKIFKLRIQPNLTKNRLLRFFMRVPRTRKMLHRMAGRKLYKSFGGCLNFFGIGGSALAPDVEEFLRNASFPYAIGYGMTENAPLVAGSNASTTRFRAIGPAIENTQVIINNPDPATGEGEILVKGPSVMQGYYKDPERTAEVLKDGWLYTGDLGKLDHDGYVYIKGRSKNVIIGPSGENIYPEEIEYVLNSSKYVLESLAYALNDHIMARIHLNYELLEETFGKLNLSETRVRQKIQEIMEDLRAKANENIPSFARIHKLIEQETPFEKTPTQKIKRFLYV